MLFNKLLSNDTQTMLLACFDESKHIVELIIFRHRLVGPQNRGLMTVAQCTLTDLNWYVYDITHNSYVLVLVRCSLCRLIMSMLVSEVVQRFPYSLLHQRQFSNDTLHADYAHSGFYT